MKRTKAWNLPIGLPGHSDEFEVLSAETQRRLIVEFQRGRQAEALLTSERIDATVRNGLEAQVRTGRRAKGRLVCSNLRLVIWVVARTGTRVRNLERDDLIQEGVRGLVRAIEKFDLSLGTNLSTYATWWIRQAIGRADMSAGLVRIPIHVQDGSVVDAAARKCAERFDELISIDGMVDELEAREEEWEAGREVDEWPDAGFELDRNLSVDYDPVDNLAVQELAHKALSHLTQREAYVLRCRCGLEGDQQTLEEVGQRLNLTRERVRQIEKVALEKSRKHLADAA